MSLRPTKRRIDFLGLPIAVEIEVGEDKRGHDSQGREWSHTYAYPYGEIEQTLGADGDCVDVYLGDIEDAQAPVFVVHQLNRDGTPDEDKVMLGFPNPFAAQLAYREHGPDWGFGSMDTMTLDEFKHGYLAAARLPQTRLYDTAAARDSAGRSRYGS